MAEKKKKATRRKKVEAAPPEPPPLKDRLLGAIFQPRFLLWGALAGAAVVLTPIVTRVLPDLSTRDEYRLRTRDIQVPDLPRWVPITLVDQVIEAAGLPDEVSVLKPDLAVQIATAFEQHPWVKKPVSVKVSVPARVEVSFDFREPVAMVSISDGHYPVDAEGILLPPGDFPPSDIDLYPKVTGMTTPPLARVGSAWGDERVTAAARLAVVLFPYWSEWKLQSVEVPPRATAEVVYEELRFVVNTVGGSRIIWGRAPGNDHPLEVTDEQKIGRLKSFLSKAKSFDGPWEININHLRVITVNPLEDRQTSGLR
ncbi:MAG: hypothetical protein O2983_05975 [Planctomycetota bacterium]|nr:hypothetical protein [Planctomycetota bacterium]MDA0917662.1 hypothetical protein [Planctomycetota bacterium]MDA1159141.1 hypothetical protein [Planctomycetota bacterium]